MIFFNTEEGDFGLAFLDDETLAVGLPPGKTAGIKFHVSPQFWRVTDQGGEFKFIRNLSYDTNAEIVENQILPEQGGYTVVFIVHSSDDSTITINIRDSNEVQAEVPPFSSIGDAAEEHVTQSAASVSAHDDQVGVDLARVFENHGRGRDPSPLDPRHLDVRYRPLGPAARHPSRNKLVDISTVIT